MVSPELDASVWFGSRRRIPRLFIDSPDPISSGDRDDDHQHAVLGSNLLQLALIDRLLVPIAQEGDVGHQWTVLMPVVDISEIVDGLPLRTILDDDAVIDSVQRQFDITDQEGLRRLLCGRSSLDDEVGPGGARAAHDVDQTFQERGKLSAIDTIALGDAVGADFRLEPEVLEERRQRSRFVAEELLDGFAESVTISGFADECESS